MLSAVSSPNGDGHRRQGGNIKHGKYLSKLCKSEEVSGSECVCESSCSLRLHNCLLLAMEV